jgi:hypothetical protein
LLFMTVGAKILPLQVPEDEHEEHGSSAVAEASTAPAVEAG